MRPVSQKPNVLSFDGNGPVLITYGQMSWLKHLSLPVLAIVLCGANFQAAWGQAISAPAPDKCSCQDGRSFAVGGALYGKNSTRIVITNLKVGAYSSAPAPESARCESLLVAGQTVTQKNDGKGHLYLQRETVKRGAIDEICASQITFKKPGKPNIIDEVEAELRRLEKGDEADELAVDEAIPKFEYPDLGDSSSVKAEPGNNAPGESPFDTQPFKDGAFVIVRKAHGEVHRGTLGRLDKLAGNADPNIWTVDSWPNSLPQPFWRLVFGPRGTTATVKKVIVPEPDLEEINELLDRLRIDTIHFGQAKDDEESPYTSTLRIYSQIVPLEQNLAKAAQNGAVERISGIVSKLSLSAKSLRLFDRRELVVLDDLSEKSAADPQADFTHRQCFIGLGALNAKAAVGGLKFEIHDVDVRVFKPVGSSADSSKVSDRYYAIDLAFVADSSGGGASIPVVCRFPGAPIGLDIVDMSIKILSQAFDIGPGNSH